MGKTLVTYQARHEGDFSSAPTGRDRDILPLMEATAFKGQAPPPRVWHVEDLVPSGTVTLLNGDGGTGKSLIALQLAVATVLGRAWIGKQTGEGPCLFLTAEDDLDEIHRRLADISAAEQVGFGDLEGLVIASLAGSDALLAIPEGKSNIVRPTELFAVLQARVAEMQPALVVLDTLADLFGGEENHRAQARQFISLLRGLAIHHGTTVLLLAHPSLSGMASGSGSSGSTAWNNSVRSRLYLSRIIDDGYEQDPCRRVLTTKKANYSAAGGEIGLTWRAGVFVADAGPSSLDKMAMSNKAERAFLDLLDEFTAQGRHVSAGGGINYAPKAFAEHPRSEGIQKRAFRGAMEALLSRGDIVNLEDGPPSRRVRYLARARSA